jgi:hypothetical protein
MTPFDINPDNDAGHTIDQNDLIAFHLHELSTPQERAVHRVLHTNPALQSESLAIASTLRAFPKHEAPLPLDAAALDRHWLALLPSLPLHVPPAITPRGPFFRNPFFRWTIPALAVSALAAAAIILSLHHNPHTAPPTLATTIPPPMAATASNSVPPFTSVHPSSPVLTYTSVPPASSTHAPFLNNPTLQAATSIPSSPPLAQPTPNQPITAPPSAEASPANTRIATTQPPALVPPPTPPTALTSTRPSPRIHHDHLTEVTIAAFGNLTAGRSFTSSAGTGTSAGTARFGQSTNPAIGVLASFHQQLRPWLGYRVTADYSEPSFQYSYSTPGSSTSINAVNQHAYEVSGSYVVQSPRRHHVSVSTEAGAGLLALIRSNPGLSSAAVASAYRPAAVVGASVDFALSKHWAFHTGYRALLYRAPAAYSTYGSIIPTTPGNLTLSNEPVIGLTYRFHPTSAE